MDDHHCSPRETHERLGERPPVITLGQLGLDVIHRVRDRVELRRPRRGGNRGPNRRVKDQQAGAVPQTIRDGRHRHDRIHGVFDTRERCHLARHQAAVVQHVDDGLVLLGAIGANDEPVCSSRGRPVDLAEVIVDGEIPQLFKLGSATELTNRTGSHVHPVPAHPQLSLGAARKARENPQLGRQPPGLLATGETERPIGADRHLPQVEVAPASRQ